jgi:T1SS-143 domain-containing protein
MSSTITITGNVIEDENLGVTTLAPDSDATNSDNNVTLSTFQSSIPTSSSLGTELTNLGIYPSTSTGTGTKAAIGISDNAIVSTSDTNLIFSNSSGSTLSAVPTGFNALNGNEIFLYSDLSNPDIVLGLEGTGTTANPNGTVAFALLLQPTSGGATIWVVQYEALTNTNPSAGEDLNTLNLANLVYVSGTSTSTETFNIGTKLPGNNYWLPFTSSDGTQTVLVTGLDSSASSPDTVNTSTTGDGSNSNSITPLTALRFDFVSKFLNNPATGTKDKTFLSDGSLNSLVYTEGTGATFDISKTTPSNSTVNVQIIAQNESAPIFDGTQTDTSTNLVPLTEIKVFTGGVKGTLVADSSRTINNNGITFGGTTSAPDGTVNGLTAGETIQILTGSAQFDQFVVENITGTGNSPGFLILNVTETQSNTTTTSEEVGSHILFEDSVPSASSATVTAIVDEDALAGVSPGEPITLNGVTASYTGSATGNLSTLFNPGVDTPLTYRLTPMTSAQLAAVLPVLTSGGAAVTYAESSAGGVDTLTATAGTTTVFTLALTESTGAFTFTLKAPIDQETPQNGSPEGTFSFDVSSLIEATDKDGNFAAGDTATATAKALTLTIIDDQPTATTTQQTAIVDEDALAGVSPGEPITLNGVTASYTGSATGNLSTLFNPGADKPLTYTLLNLANLNSGALPSLTSDGVSVVYSVSADGSTLTAKAGTTTVFTLAINETTGAYTFTLSAPIDQEKPQNGSPEGTFSFDVSSLVQATDADGSHVTAASNALTLTIIDDQPTLTGKTSTGSVDEDALSTNLLPDSAGATATASDNVSSLYNAGADKPLTFTLSSVTTSLTNQKLTSGGKALSYSESSSTDGAGVTTETLTATADAGQPDAKTVFTMALTENGANAGAWTFTLDAPVDQAPGANDSSQTTIDFSQMVTATDADGSAAPTAAANAWTVTVTDDVPVNFNPEAIVSGDNVQDATGSTFTGNLINTVAADGTVDPNSSLNIEQHAGADGFGALTFTGNNGSQLTGKLGGGTTQNLQSNGQNIYLFGFGTGTLTATTDSTGAGLPGGAQGSVITADKVFTVTTNPGSNNYTFNMLAPINNNSTFFANDFADVPPGSYAWFALPFTGGAPVSPGESVVFTGTAAGVDRVGPSSQGVGVDAQNIAIGRDIRIDFVDNVSPSGSAFVKSDLSSLSNLDYADHFEVGTGGFQISQVNPGGGKPVSIHIDALNVDPTLAYNGGAYPADSGDEVIQSVIVKDSAGNVIFNKSNPGDTSAVVQGGITVNFNEANPTETNLGADGANIAGLLVGDTVLVSTLSSATPNTTFDRMLATTLGPSSNSTFDLGGVTGLTFVAGSNVSMAFNLALQDYDAFNSGLNGSLTEAGTGTLNINLTAPQHA